MIIRRTVKFQKRRDLVTLKNGGNAGEGVLLQISTWWFLFIPVLTIRKAQ